MMGSDRPKSSAILYSLMADMNKLIISLILSACMTAPGWAQPRPSGAPVAPPALSKEMVEQLQSIRDAALSSDYAWKQLAHITENIGPRPAGSAQAQAASEYVAAEMRKLGLDVHLEEARVSHWVRGEEKAELVEFPGQPPQVNQRIVLTALSGAAATPAEGITADVLVVHSFAELTALGREKVAGKIVLFNVRYDTRKALGWDYKPFEIPSDILDAWRLAGLNAAKGRADWEKRLAAAPAGTRTEFERRMRGELRSGGFAVFRVNNDKASTLQTALQNSAV